MVLSPGAGRTSAAGGLPFWSPAYPAFSLLFCPHPPDPLPLRGRGRLKVILCKGLRPLHPRAEPGRHRLFLWKAGSGGGLRLLRGGVGVALRCPEGGAGGVVARRPCLAGTRRGRRGGSRLPTLPLALFLPPSPRPPSRREGGDSKYISPGATAPGTPAIGWDAARAFLVESGFLWSSQLCKGFKALQVWMRHW